MGFGGFLESRLTGINCGKIVEWDSSGSGDGGWRCDNAVIVVSAAGSVVMMMMMMMIIIIIIIIIINILCSNVLLPTFDDAYA